jgi:uncharacterized membrane protein
VALAADSSGNINVEVTKLDNGFSYLALVLLGIVILFALVISILLLLKRKSLIRTPKVPVPKKKTTPKKVDLKDEQQNSFKQEGYYTALFEKPKPKIEISDERSEPVSFISSETDNTTENNVERYLKEDERIVVNVLKMKHNSCSQATLRVVTDFSKARLSRILAELETRGVVYKEQQGRKNLITLKT